MEGPTPVSALIHAATLVIAGVYFLARLSPMLIHTPGVLDAVAAVGLFTAFIGAFLALAQNDLKRVLAYSTVSQLGFMVLAMGSFGFAAGIFHLLTHGFFKALLFLGSGSVMHAMDDELDMRKMGGLRRAMPATFVLFAVGTFALAGLFPLSGFFSKDEILLGVLDGRNGWLLAAGLAASGLTALYAARMLFMVFAGEPRSDTARRAHESGPLMLVPMAALAIPAAGLGLLALNWGDFGGILSFLHLPGGAHHYEINHAVFWPSLIVAFGLFIAGRFIYAPRGAEPAPSIVERRYPRLYAFVANKFYLDELYQWAVDNVVLAASRFIAVFDRRVVNDTGVDGPGKATVLAGRALRYHETGLIGTYILTIAVTAAAAIIIMVGGELGRPSWTTRCSPSSSPCPAEPPRCCSSFPRRGPWRSGPPPCSPRRSCSASPSTPSSPTTTAPGAISSSSSGSGSRPSASPSTGAPTASPRSWCCSPASSPSPASSSPGASTTALRSTSSSS